MSKNGTNNRGTQNGQLCGNYREDVAWLAGVVDGEGHFNLHYMRSKNGFLFASPKIIISNCSEPLTEKSRRTIFAVTRKKPRVYVQNSSVRNYPIFRIHISDQRSLRKLCEAMLPHLTAKRKSAEILISFYRLRKAKKHSGGSAYDIREVLLMEEMKLADPASYMNSGRVASTERAAPTHPQPGIH